MNDLAPIATLISRNYNADFDVTEFEREAEKILEDTKRECGWMYKTNPTENVFSIQQKKAKSSVIIRLRRFPQKAEHQSRKRWH